MELRPGGHPLFRSSWFRKTLFAALVFALGVTTGGMLFHDVQPRRPFTSEGGLHFWDTSQITGLVGAVMIKDAPALIPGYLFQTERSVAMMYPVGPDRRHHFVVIPKRDIYDAGTLAKGDEPYLIDAFAVLGRLVRERKLVHYKIITNGSGEQLVSYLHFHLVSADAPETNPPPVRPKKPAAR
jgi:diadenosine tetraphosphate (Ap4A) HIT family hydrolase